MYLHSIELRLATAEPRYSEFQRCDALQILHDCRENMRSNGRMSANELPEVVVLASAFNEFYEGALGAYSTHSVFGAHVFESMQHVAKVADIIGWTEICDVIKNTREALEKYQRDVLEEYLVSISASPKVFDQLSNLLVLSFETLVEKDSMNGHKMRRCAHDWVVTQLDPNLCDDTNAVPLLPRTIELARSTLGLDVEIPSIVEWRAALTNWQSTR